MYIFFIQNIQNANKSRGLVIFRDEKQLDYFELFWQYLEEDCQFDREIEKLLKENFPFREVKTKKSIIDIKCNIRSF